MGKTLIVSKLANLEEHKRISEEYGVGFEFNDFFLPDLLDHEESLESVIESYEEIGLPDYCTMHGVFLDIIPFSSDSLVRRVSYIRMEQSMKLAERLGAKGVVFHTNCYPLLSSEAYDRNVIESTVHYLKQLLPKYPDINIYMENMFDEDAHIMVAMAEKLKEYKNFGLCFDYAHASISPTPIDKWVEDIAPYVKHLHINDNDFVKDSHLPVGAGKTDWMKFNEYYHKYFEHCSVLVENTSPEYQRESLEYMKNVLNWDFENKEEE